MKESKVVEEKDVTFGKEMSHEDAINIINAEKAERERRVQEGLQNLLNENNCEVKIIVQGMVADDGTLRFGKQLQIVAK